MSTFTATAGSSESKGESVGVVDRCVACLPFMQETGLHVQSPACNRPFINHNHNLSLPIVFANTIN